MMTSKNKDKETVRNDMAKSVIIFFLTGGCTQVYDRTNKLIGYRTSVNGPLLTEKPEL